MIAPIGPDNSLITEGVGFREFVVLVANTPDAAAQLTPAARSEVCRLLQIDC